MGGVVRPLAIRRHFLWPLHGLLITESLVSFPLAFISSLIEILFRGEIQVLPPCTALSNPFDPATGPGTKKRSQSQSERIDADASRKTPSKKAAREVPCLLPLPPNYQDL